MTTGVGIGSGNGLPLVVAHRGLHGSGLPEENSIGAFQAAVDAGADVIELDIHRTADGQLVIHHDAELADGRKIADLRADELPLLPDGQRIPRLAEVADLARRTGVRVAAELKEAGYEQQVVTELTGRMPASQLELISFDRESIRAIESIDPLLRTGLLEPRLPAWLRNSAVYPAALWVMDKLDWHPSLSAAAKVGADYVSVEHRMATASFIDAAHERGLPVNAWTVNDAARMRQLIRDGVDAIVTDRTDLAVQLRSQGGVAPSLPTAPPLPAAS